MGIKITYEGKPAWRVGVLVRRVAEDLEGFQMEGKEILETLVGYRLVFAGNEAEARTLARRNAYRQYGLATRAIGFWNTEKWDGVPFARLDALEEYKKRQHA